jgi:hypothetical protein
LIEARLPESGEKPFAELTRKGIKAAMKARTPSQASNLFSVLRNKSIKIISKCTTIGPSPAR